MSILSSFFWTRRRRGFKINATAASMMDHLFSILIGLGVRIVIDFVSHQDNRVVGTLVGLWEGIVIQHFLKKNPKSYDAYVAYAVRLFVDFLFSESLSRLVLTIIWTSLGVVLADVAPSVWRDTGMRRSWRHLRRDLYILTHSLPTFRIARPRTVRFSPSRSGSVVTSATGQSGNPNTTRSRPTTLAPPAPRNPPKRPVPGAFPGDASETETELGSVVGTPRAASVTSTSPGTTHRFSSFIRRSVTVESESEHSYDLDEGNISTSSDSAYTRTPTLAEVPTIEDEDELREVVLDNEKQKEDEATPKQSSMVLPPTPSDSALAPNLHQEEPQEIQPPVSEVPNIPDYDEWDNISRREALNFTPPLPAGVQTPTQPAPPYIDLDTESLLASVLAEKRTGNADSGADAKAVDDLADPWATSTPPPADLDANPPPPPAKAESVAGSNWGAVPPKKAASVAGSSWGAAPPPKAESVAGSTGGGASAKKAGSVAGSSWGAAPPAKAESVAGSSFGAVPPPKAESVAGSTWGANPPPKAGSVAGSSWGANPPPKAGSVAGSSWGANPPPKAGSVAGSSWGANPPPKAESVAGSSWGANPPPKAGSVAGSSWGAAPPAKAESVAGSTWGDAPPPKAESVAASTRGGAPPKKAGSVAGSSSGEVPPAKAESVAGSNRGEVPPTKAESVAGSTRGGAPAKKTGSVAGSSWGEAPPAKAESVADSEYAPSKAGSVIGSSWGAVPPAKAGSVAGSTRGGVPPPKAESVAGSSWGNLAGKAGSIIGSSWGAAAAPKAPSATGSSWGAVPPKKASSVTSGWGAAKSTTSTVPPSRLPDTTFTTTTGGDATVDFDSLDRDRPPSYAQFDFDNFNGSEFGGDVPVTEKKHMDILDLLSTVDEGSKAEDNATNAGTFDADIESVRQLQDPPATRASTPAPVRTGTRPSTPAPVRTATRPPTPAPAPVPTQAPVAKEEEVVDNEPFPVKGSEQASRALELRKEAIQVAKGLAELKQQVEEAKAMELADEADKLQLLIDTTTKKANRTKEKAERWYADVRGKGAADPVADINMEDVPADDIPSQLEQALALLLLKNKPALKVKVAMAKKGGKAQKAAITSTLNTLKIDVPDTNRRDILITLPTTGA
ncbi:hypothetical protein H0H81_002093 [Sphagnurus paluster]|uniref:Uncharacterized protein n=1 Tax=Sphagnurus paluster TaxID=117069 RepID=A0A9P7FVW0_9AGAR|nr:hypothetical protein H0H81_002093 [Sphagnurus paluster]